MIRNVLKQYEIYDYDAIPYGKGLINSTWKINVKDEEEFILQQINKNVFHQPPDIDFNVRKIKSFLEGKRKTGVLPFPVETTGGESIVVEKEEYFRLTEFKNNTFVSDTISDAQQAFGAAKKFGQFTADLSGFDAAQLKITIPHFHDLSFRFAQFKEALHSGNQKRISESKDEIDYLIEQASLVLQYEEIKLDTAFSLRVMHHDTKINNILFDKSGDAAWVIDPDTIMPGYIISDLGDMFRTYLPSMGENDKDYKDLTINIKYFTAIVEGYLSEMITLLSDRELKFIVYAGQFMVYMQALRFLTDYLMNDPYYRILYPEHNFIRAKNQITLLKLYNSHTQLFNEIVEKVCEDLKQ